jgi:hypothetical protein
MITLLPEVHDRSTSNRDAFAAEHGLVREAPRSWSSKPVTEQPPAEVPETPAASSAKEIPLLTFRRDDELGECFERICEAISLGTCDELVRQMEADYAKRLLAAQAQSG